MKIFQQIAFGLFLFLLTHVLLYSFANRTNPRQHLYYYPNGYIVNSNVQNQNFLGFNIFHDVKFPKFDLGIEPEDYDFTKSLLNKSEFDFIPHIIGSAVFFMIAVWFFWTSGDILISYMMLLLALLITSDMYLLCYGSVLWLFYFILFQIGFLILHLSVRLKGRDIPSKWMVPEIAFSALIAYFGNTSSSDPGVFTRMVTMAGGMILFFSLSAFLVSVYDLIKYRQDDTNKTNKLLVAAGILSVISMQYIIYSTNLLKGSPILRYSIYFFYLIFPLTFIYSSYRYQVLPQQILFNSSLTSIFLFLISVVSYFVLYSAVIFITPASPGKNEGLSYESFSIFNYIFLFITVIYIYTLKKYLSDLIDRWTFSRNPRLKESLQEFTNLISSRISLKDTVRTISEKIAEALQVEKVIMLVPAYQFPKYNFKDLKSIMKIQPASEVWNYFSRQKGFTVSSYLQYGSGSREHTMRFLNDLKIQLSYTIMHPETDRLNAVFLLGEKKSKKGFTIGEIFFIKECSRIANLLLQNYLLLNSEIEKKKMQREFTTAEIINNTLLPPMFDSAANPELDLQYVNLAASGISGDYVDFIQSEDGRLYIFLGDITGHGVGSGLLVSAVKAIIRSNVEMNRPLQKIFETINRFLNERYPGFEFMSLFGLVYDSKSSSSEYINAGHIPPVIIGKNGDRRRFEATETLLGVAPGRYPSVKLSLEPGDKMFVFSDGIIEALNPAYEQFGVERLIEIIQKNISLPSEELIEILLDSVREFRKEGELDDDASLICLTRKDRVTEVGMRG